MPGLVEALFPNGPLLCAALLSRASGQLSGIVWDLSYVCVGGGGGTRVTSQKIEDGAGGKKPLCASSVRTLG